MAFAQGAGGVHAQCSGKVARRAAIFQAELCETVLRGIHKQMVHDGMVKPGEIGPGIHMLDGDEYCDTCPHARGSVHADPDGPVLASSSVGVLLGEVTGGRKNQSGAVSKGRQRDPESASLSVGDLLGEFVGGRKTHSDKDDDILPVTGRSDKFVDALTGQPLPADLCKEARRVENQYFRDKGVWEMRSIQEAMRVTGRRPITIRWVEVNKGDNDNPRIRSRLVAREIRGPGQEPCFAPTPPLESLRMVLSYAVTDLAGQPPKSWAPGSAKRMQISLVDVSRAYFNAPTDDSNPTYVDLPVEAGEPPGTCALLRKHMYGTQKAADGWQSEYSGTLIAMGFVQGTASACVFSHPGRSIVVSVHGDDFTAAGACEDLDWYEAELAKRYEISLGWRLGPGPDDRKEATILNRVVRWTAKGLEYEADPRQAERLIHDLDLSGPTNGCVTPGVKVLAHQAEEETELPEREHTKFRGHSARGNYLSAQARRL